jgi:adenylate cyclase
MSIRGKFFALAGILLMLFGIVVGVLAISQASIAHQLENIVAHYQPLRRLLADLDVATDEYELRIERLRRWPDRSDTELQSAAADIERVGARIRENFQDLHAALDRAVAHNQGSPKELLDLSRVQGALPFIERQVDPFLATGRAVTDALIAHQPEVAHALALGLTKFEDAFGPDLSAMRGNVADLTEKAAAAIYREQRLNSILSFGLFALASGIGLGISSFGSKRVVAALNKLLVSTRAIEEGRTDVTVPVLTRDEVGALARAFNRMLVELRERERIKEMFGKFIDPRIVARLIAVGEGATDPAERKVVTIFFSDIKNFSSISEQLTAAAMVTLLNAYFTAVAEKIRRYNGIIDKYMGDSVMAFWCAPFSPGDEHALDGCKAALAQLHAAADIRRRLPELTGLRRNVPDLVLRMGIATGEVVVGAIGSPNARSYTVIGDTVNLASRLEGVNKVYGTSVILAEETYRLTRHAIEARELDIVTVAGKSEAIRIYELMAEAGELAPAQIELCSSFAQGLEAYRHQDWDAAEKYFEACRLLAPEDGPSAVYLKRVASMRTDPPPKEWDGVWRLTAK